MVYSSIQLNFLDISLVIVRLILAVVMGSHGWYKSFGKQGFNGSAERFKLHGIPWPLFFSYLTSLSQLLAVPLFLTGFFTRIISMVVMLEMIVAAWVKYRETKRIFDGADLPLSDLGLCLILIVSGAGHYSIDTMIFNK